MSDRRSISPAPSWPATWTGSSPSTRRPSIGRGRARCTNGSGPTPTWRASTSPGPRRGAVVAYCAGWIIFDELHVNNLAVDPPWRRRGVASALLTFVLEAAAAEGATRATLEVRRSNEPARRLYERFGFAFAGVRTAYYREPVEDALVLWRNGPRPRCGRNPEIRMAVDRLGLNRRESGGTVVTSRSRVGIRSRSHGPTAPHGASDRGGRAWPSR